MESDDMTDGEAAVADKSDADHKGQDAGRKGRSWLTEFVVLVVVALVIALTIKTFIVQPFVIPTASMQNTILVHDKVLVNKLVGHVSQIHRGDVVVFNGAGDWDPPITTDNNPLARIYRDFLGMFGATSGQTDYIKRVIGLPGDHVQCCNAQGLLTVNSVPLHERSYLPPGSTPSTIKFSIVVPAGQLWVMGDNREDSADSRYHDCQLQVATCESWDRDGTIPESKVIGRAFAVVWPLSRIKMLWVPATFGQAALSAGHSDADSRPAGRSVLAGRAAAPMTDQLRAVPGGLTLPLAAGGLIAVPLTLLERKLRLRIGRRLWI